VNAQTTNATAPPGVSYLQPPYAAVHHDTDFSHRKLQPEDPIRSASHIDMTISNLLIPPDDPREHPSTITRKLGPAYPPTAI